MTELDVKMLAELIDEPHRPTPIRKRSYRRQRVYHATAVVHSRLKVEQALASGVVPVNRQHTRDALCDAAIHILCRNLEGADTIRQVLGEVFAHDPDAADAITDRVKSGRIKRKFSTSS